MKELLNLKQVKNLISSVGKDVTVHVEGSPGIGKSSILWSMAEAMPDHIPVYIDCADLDLGDLAMPVINHETKSTAYYPNERFQLHQGKPLIIMLDELTKANEPVKNMLMPVLLERRLGAVKFHPDTYVFSTGNLATDGVGDSLKAHARNRITVVQLRNSTDDEWIEWAVENDIAPEVMAWVKQFPHCLAMYQDASQKDNEYIYHPRKMQDAFVTLRSLAKASPIVKARHALGYETTLAALTGTIGEAAARDMQAYFSLADGLPSREAIYTAPESAPVPSDPAARVILVLRELVSLKEEHFKAWMTYLKRLPKEQQALFATSVMASSRRAMAASDEDFTKWAVDNHIYF